MDDLVIMTSEEIRKKYGNDKVRQQAMLDAAPEFSPEELGFMPGPTVARGWAAFQEYLKTLDQAAVVGKAQEVDNRNPFPGIRSGRPALQSV